MESWELNSPESSPPFAHPQEKAARVVIVDACSESIANIEARRKVLCMRPQIYRKQFSIRALKTRTRWL